jgi:hypothetical protein
MHYIEKNRGTVVSVIYVLNVNCQNNSLIQNISLFQYIMRKIEVRTCWGMSATKELQMQHPGIANYNILYFLSLGSRYK